MRGIHRSLVNSPHKGQWCGALTFFFICAWIDGWVNNREAGDLRHHRAHYDVTVMVAYTSVQKYGMFKGDISGHRHIRTLMLYIKNPVQWRHYDRNGISNNRCLECLINHFFRCRSTKTPKLRVTGFVRAIHRSAVDSPYKGPVTQQMFLSDDVTMQLRSPSLLYVTYHLPLITKKPPNYPFYTHRIIIPAILFEF